MGLMALSCGYFIIHLWANLHDMPAVDWDATAWLSMVVAVVGTLGTVLLIALMWRLLLRDQGVHLPYRQALQIVAVSQMGKYLPGNVGHFVGRVLLGSRAGIPAGKTVATMAMETFWILAICGLFAVLALLLYVDNLHEGLIDSDHPGYLAGVSALMLLAPFLGVRLVNRLLPGLSRKLGQGELLAEPRLGTSVAVAGLIVLCFLLLGTVVEVLASDLFGHQEVDWLQMVLLFTVAWTAGFLVPGSPGGLGVREAVMIKLMGPVIGMDVALGVSIVMRLTSMLGDALAFGVGLLFAPATTETASDDEAPAAATEPPRHAPLTR